MSDLLSRIDEAVARLRAMREHGGRDYACMDDAAALLTELRAEVERGHNIARTPVAWLIHGTGEEGDEMFSTTDHSLVRKAERNRRRTEPLFTDAAIDAARKEGGES